MMNEQQSYYMPQGNTNHKNIEQPAPSHGLNDAAPNCHTKIVTTTSLYFGGGGGGGEIKNCRY
jgi:hypothetical protein